jgi:hypothetical protein
LGPQILGATVKNLVDSPGDQDLYTLGFIDVGYCPGICVMGKGKGKGKGK